MTGVERTGLFRDLKGLPIEEVRAIRDDVRKRVRELLANEHVYPLPYLHQ
jgi:hypothetical protein